MTNVPKVLNVPVVPNRPLVIPEDTPRLGEMALRRNVALGLVENQHFDPALVEYDEQYQNDQTESAVFRAHMAEVIEILKEFGPRQSRLVEVGCGKGQFVEMLMLDCHFQVTGYDAAYQGFNPNIHSRYLSEGERIKCDLVVLRHVLEHVQDPYNFLRMLKEIFGNIPIYCEVPDFDWILDSQAFFDVTYEHVNYFNQKSLKSLFGGNVLRIGRLFGEQYLFVVARLGDLSAAFAEQYSVEENWEALDFYQLFPSFHSQLDKLERQETVRRFYIWGAATKGCLFAYHLANLGSQRERLGFVVDINPAKWSKFVPGTSIPIHSPEYLFKSIEPSDAVIVANPNYEIEVRTLLANQGHGRVTVWSL